MRCSKIGNLDMLRPHSTGTSIIDREQDISDNGRLPSLPSNELDDLQVSNSDQLLRKAVISFLVFWVFIALGAGIYDPSSLHLAP